MEQNSKENFEAMKSKFEKNYTDLCDRSKFIKNYLGDLNYVALDIHTLALNGWITKTFQSYLCEVIYQVSRSYSHYYGYVDSETCSNLLIHIQGRTKKNA